MKKHIIFISLIVSSACAIAQLAPPPPPSISTEFSVLIAIPYTTIIAGITMQGKPVFNNAGMNNIVNQFNVTGFAKEYPTSRFLVMRQVYKLKTNSTNLCEMLQTAYPLYFPKWTLLEAPELLTDYYPNDYVNNWPVRSAYLDYIHAPTAWGVTHGDPNVIIGITDTYLDTAHPDLQYKMAQVSNNILSQVTDTELIPHGTQVTGAAVAATDNGIGYPSIGFNCRVDFSGNWAIDDELLLMSQRNRKILTGSWMYHTSNALELDYFNQSVYHEIYENGTLTCIAAGNTKDCKICPPTPWLYCYPASYDYVFSTSGVGWENEHNGVNTFNVKGVHQINSGDTADSHRHNTRVDLLAPSVRVGCITYDSNDATHKYNWDSFWGTSIASPQTAGTAGLMLSVNPCLTPYQLEYILKKSANDTILSYSENLKYTGRLGAGALDAGKAVKMADPNLNHTYQGINRINCNNPATQTFYIEGIEFNSLCAPGYAGNGVNPQLTPVLKNGTPPYTYRWESVAGNTATLSSQTAVNPIITASTPNGSGQHIASYYLTVYDGSDVQKVASKYIYLTLSTANDFDLALRDHYMDMLDEPNSMTVRDPRIWDYWASPDLWNRQAKDGGLIHQNPEYFITDSNYAYVRVRNVGCAASPAIGNSVHLYWSKASTGERWKDDWDGTTQVAAASGGVIPGGGELTTTAAVPIPALQPGQQSILVQGWRPPNPKLFYGSPVTMDACLLARIEDATHGMTIPEVFTGSITTNVRNNNKIVTRNMVFTNLNPNDKPTTRHQIFIANAESEATRFDLQLINERGINPHFAGDFSAVGYITLYLGDLYEVWIHSGGKGNYASRNAVSKTVVFDGSTTLELQNLDLPAGTKFPVDVEFSLREGAQVNTYSYMVHLRQFLHEAAFQSVYGNVSFQVNTRGNEDALFRKAAVAHQEETNTNFRIHPNPTTDRLTIAYPNDQGVIVDVCVYDVMGRKLVSKESQY
ncbi:MAG: S8 family serine peptidase, partial [Bacteroidetes bacterium]|nr:S8 family serine peptidase [Bacteroidota bacterium]